MIGFGILGAGTIAHRFAASLAHERRARLVAASCRSEEKARAFLREVEAPAFARAWGGHERLLEDDEVDAIYLALPHGLHAQWAREALSAGKAVLCEKPAMLDASEMRAIQELARECGALFMEAMKPRFVPLYRMVRQACESIGTLVRVEATLCNDMLAHVMSAGTYHMAQGPGSGVLLDCGTYCASWIEDYCTLADGVDLVSGDYADRSGIDVYADARLRIGVREARLECAFDRAKPRTATLLGTRGSIVIDELHRPQRAVVSVEGLRDEVIEAPYVIDDFFGEIVHFIDLLEGAVPESPIMSLAASVGTAELLDVVRDGFEVWKREQA